MSVARTLLVAAATTVTVGVTSPGAWAASAGDWDKDDHSYSSDYRHHGEGEHNKPKGGMHTGGGALASSDSTAIGALALLSGLGAGTFMLRRRLAGGTA